MQRPNFLVDFGYTIQEKVASLIQQTVALPEEAQAELVQILLEMRFKNAGVYQLNDEEREALDRSEDDVRAGRFASEGEVEATFARCRA